jgi:hypothetical protein
MLSSVHVAPGLTLVRAPMSQAISQIDERKFWLSVIWAELAACDDPPSELICVGVQVQDEVALTRAVNSAFMISCHFFSPVGNSLPDLTRCTRSRLVVVAGQARLRWTPPAMSRGTRILVKPLEDILRTYVDAPNAVGAPQNEADIVVQLHQGAIVPLAKVLEEKKQLRTRFGMRQKEDAQGDGRRFEAQGWGAHAVRLSPSPFAGSAHVQILSAEFHAGAAKGLWNESDCVKRILTWISSISEGAARSPWQCIISDHDPMRAAVLIREIEKLNSGNAMHFYAPDLSFGFHPAVTRLQLLSDGRDPTVLIDASLYPLVSVAIRTRHRGESP